jgi:hypothetical protein
MALYVTILTGSSAETAEPLVATSDQRVAQAALRAIARVAASEAERKPKKGGKLSALRVVEPQPSAADSALAGRG